MMKKIKRVSGATLIEMVVSFALIAIFMAAAVVMVTATVHTYARIRQDMVGQNTCDMLLDRIEGEIRQANMEDAVICAENETLNYTDDTAIRFDAGTAFCFRNGNGVRVCVFVLPQAENTKIGSLVLHYYENGSQQATNWQYDDVAMQNFSVQSLYFTEINDSTVEVELILKSTQSDYTCTAKRTIYCDYLKKDGHKIVPSGSIW